MVRVFIGFHGTSKASADMILLDKRFLPSNREDEWLGKGIYFFENDPEQAIDWCVRARKYKEWAILKSVIKAREVLDLTRKRGNGICFCRNLLNNGGAVTVDFKEVVEQINQYLARVTIEQFESDLQKAGIEQCPDIGEETDCEWQPESFIVEYSILEEPYSDLTNGYIAIANGEAA